MNQLGKIFTVGIFVTALFLMWISMMVYSTHKNWKVEAVQLESQLSAAKAENEQLESSYRSLDSQLKAEIEAAQQEVRKLESERVQLMTQNTNVQKDLDDARQQERVNTAAVASTQKNNEKLASEVERLREEVRVNQQARDDAFASTLKATDQLHQAQGLLKSIRQRSQQLVQELGNKNALLRRKSIDPATDLETVVPTVRGVVSAMQRSTGSQLIEVTIGADDGLKPGHTLEVFRGERYLGRAEILKTEPDRAVGRVIRRFQQGQIQEGDHVATRLRVG